MLPGGCNADCFIKVLFKIFMFIRHYSLAVISQLRDQSYGACSNEGLQMLRIESNQTQTVVDRLLQDLALNTLRLVCIGERWYNDNT